MRLGLACDGAPPPEPLLDLLERAGLPADDVRGVAGPALLAAAETTWLLAPGADVLEACARGALDAGVVGKELLLELSPQVHELLDLRVCPAALVYATPAPPARTTACGRPRVATPYPRVTRRHFAARGRQLELVAFEAAALAAGLGIADGVVVLSGDPVTAARVLSGELVVREEIVACSPRLVAGRAARALGADRLAELLEHLRAALGER